MFERYTEKARRVIFFARYEASQYGSAYIESEHLLLGLFREDLALARRFLRPGASISEIRHEIERQIKRGQPIPTSREVPLAQECKKILNMAGEEADRLGHRHIGTEHLLLAMTRIESSLAARLLRERALGPDAIRAELAKPMSAKVTAQGKVSATAVLDNFLAALKSPKWEQLSLFFSENAQFVDSAGKRCRGRREIERESEGLFAPYAKKNVMFLIEATDCGPADSFVTSILWENVSIGAQPRSLHRMTIILAPENEDWTITFIQVTPVVVQTRSAQSA